MKTRFLIGITLLVGLYLTLAFQLEQLLSFSTGLQPVYPHTAEQTVLDVMEVSTQPVVTTRSAARALMYSPTLPNWSDEMIRKLASMRGVICVPFLAHGREPGVSGQMARRKTPRFGLDGTGAAGLSRGSH